MARRRKGKNKDIGTVVISGLIIFMTVGVTFARETLTHLGMETNYLLGGLIAVAVTGLLAYRQLFLIVLTVLISIAVNFPPLFLQEMGVNKDVLLITLVTIVILPLVVKFLE